MSSSSPLLLLTLLGCSVAAVPRNTPRGRGRGGGVLVKAWLGWGDNNGSRNCYRRALLVQCMYLNAGVTVG